MTPVSIVSLFGSEAAFEAAFAEAYAEAGLPMVCDLKQQTQQTQQDSVVLCCVPEVVRAD